MATKQEEREVTVGDIVYLPAGEKHSHGATKDSYLSYITRQVVKSSLKNEERPADTYPETRPWDLTARPVLGRQGHRFDGPSDTGRWIRCHVKGPEGMLLQGL